MNSKIFVLLTVCLALTGCGMEASEKAKGKEQVKKYSQAFIRQAKKQYGEKAKVKKISFGVDIFGDALAGPAEKKVNNTLTGKITADGKTFKALYFIETNEIYSLKNYDAILDSLEEYFDYLGLDIIDSSIFNSAYIEEPLPDNIKTYEDLIRNGYYFDARIFVGDKLDKLTVEDFEKLKNFWDNLNQADYDPSNGVGTVTFIQVENESKIGILKNSGGTGFSYKGTVYDSEKKEYVDEFEYYGILSSISLKYIHREFRFTYLER